MGTDDPAAVLKRLRDPDPEDYEPRSYDSSYPSRSRKYVPVIVPGPRGRRGGSPSSLEDDDSSVSSASSSPVSPATPPAPVHPFNGVVVGAGSGKANEMHYGAYGHGNGYAPMEGVLFHR